MHWHHHHHHFNDEECKKISSAPIFFILELIPALASTLEKSVLVVDVDGHHPGGGGR